MPDLALELGKNAVNVGVSATYGEQQDVDGVRFVPVAVVGYGFGAGEDGDANGGGGGGFAMPVGAYIRQGDGLRFEPNMISLLAVGIPFVWVAGRAIARTIRALKR